jgi:hypothetical protein
MTNHTVTTDGKPTVRAYNTTQVATILGVRPWQVRNLIRTRQLRARSTGAQYIVPVSAVEEYLAGGDDPIANHGDPAA